MGKALTTSASDVDAPSSDGSHEEVPVNISTTITSDCKNGEGKCTNLNYVN